MDALNGFNTINRNVFLHNITIICPPLAWFVKNCYYANTRLFIIGGGEIQPMEKITQGDSTAMEIYAITIIPLILMLVAEANQVDNTTKTAAHADDFTAAGTIMRLRNWWETLCILGHKFGYFPEKSKSWLIVKEKEVQKAQSVFKDTSIKITTESQLHLFAVTGSEIFKQKYVQDKIDQWIKELRVLCKIAWCEPQAAYSGFVKGFKHKPIYFMRTIPNIKTQLKQLDDVIRTEFIPAITGGANCSDTERRLMSLPPRIGGLGIPIFLEFAQEEYEFLIMLSKGLTTKIINQQPQFATNHNAKTIKRKIELTKMQHHNEELQKLRFTFSDKQKRLNELNREQGASSWLTTIPLSEEGYDLTKQLFWDLIHVRYGWTLTRLPSNCECGNVSLRHNHIRNNTSILLKELRKDKRVEPQLRQLTGEYLQHSTAAGNEVRLDVSAHGSWQAGQMAFLDVRVFNPNAKRYANIEFSKAYEISKKEKKKTYNERILQVEHGSFTPLVMSVTGGMSRECKKFYSRLAEMICKKRKTSYNVTITWIRRKFAFSLIKSIGICIRGSRSVFQNDNLEMSLGGVAYTSESQSSM